MVSKRELDDVEDVETPKRESKRSKKQGKTRQHQNSGIDPTWGQKYVFSGADYKTTAPAGEESDFEDDTDAMAYLSSVRQEASGIPHLLVAPKVQIGPQLPADFERDDDPNQDDAGPIDRSIYDNGVGDKRGWYEDGAYMALPDNWGEQDDYEEGEAPDDFEDDFDEERAIHEAYFASLMDQYLHLRTILHAKPPSNALSRLTPSQSTFAAPFGNKTSPIAVWSRLLRTTDPHPLQLALMSKDTILTILRVLLGGKFLRRGYTLPERTSRWLWALLARLPDKGELNYAEIGWVRDLGRRAVLLGRSLAEMAALREELAEGGLGAHEAVDKSSSDEEVMADVEDLEVEGAVSPEQDEDNSTSPEAQKEDEASAKTGAPAQPSTQDAPAPGSPPISDAEEGEIDDQEDVAMDLESDSEAEDGEVAPKPQEDLQDAKSRLLAQLDNDPASDDEDAEQEAARQRSRANLRATLNMILTVAGEFYGQRDLLEFREPFVGM
ncbi:v-snare [Fusarium albosuccineum]|uniref:V-snare n=1 Tax=Fusarium albosuccineum TaxID=1237068 RepID=A0A8H4NWU4_9HYPO|nr:v-snare [Fusarium albosuccineum]